MLLLTGCGGGGGSEGGGPTPETKAAPQVSVAWPERSKAVSAPSSALSVKATFTRTDGSGTTTFVQDRPAGTGAQTVTYTGGQVPVGSYNVLLDFYAQTNGQGSHMGLAAFPAKLLANGSLTQPDGEPIGDVNFSGGRVSSISLQSETITVGVTTQLVPSVRWTSQGPAVVADGAFVFSVTEGGDKISVTPDGKLTGTASGSARVSVAMDGVVSAGGFITVVNPAPEFITVGMKSVGIAYDPVRNVVWSAVASDSAQYPDQIVPLNPATGSLGLTIPFANPNGLALSSDGQYLFTMRGNDLMRVNIVTHDAVINYTLDPGVTMKQLVAVPNSVATVAVVTVVTDNPKNDGGTTIVDMAGPRGTSKLVGQCVVFNDSGTVMYGMKAQSDSNQLATCTIDASGITVVSRQTSQAYYHGAPIGYQSGKIFGITGKVVDAATNALVGTFAGGMRSSHGAMVPDLGENRAYFVDSQNSPKLLRSYDSSTYAKIGTDLGISNVGGDAADLIMTGEHQAVFRTIEATKNMVVILKNLP